MKTVGDFVIRAFPHLEARLESDGLSLATFNLGDDVRLVVSVHEENVSARIIRYGRVLLEAHGWQSRDYVEELLTRWEELAALKNALEVARG